MKKYLTILLPALLFALQGSAQTDQRPNILWIVSEDNDTMLGSFGDKYATTPNLDQFAKEGIVYENTFSQPACALSRATLITGMLATSLGIEDMRSNYPIPASIPFFPSLLRKAGYYTTNNAKEDYNTNKKRDTWNESSDKATYKNRPAGQPFFSVFNLGITHESSIGVHRGKGKLIHDPEKAPIPPYLPATPEMKKDFALYYDRIQNMDQQVADLLKELDEAGLSKNTIVFYYSDNGGVLGRSKRFLYESGVHVPLIIRFPKKYAALAPGQPGSRTKRIVSFEDFGPTVLSLAGVKAPALMQGVPFLGQYQQPEKQYALAFRGRIDETIELSRAIRDKQFRYIRNFMPHKIYGQHNEYYWETPSIVSWENAYKAGKLNATQSSFWHEKPSEELYDVIADPDNIHNLATDKKYQQVLERMRKDLHSKMLKDVDAGFIPESMRVDISKNSTIYQYAHSEQYPLERILETAEMASSRDNKQLAELSKRLSDPNPIVRYWAATGCTILGKQAIAATNRLMPLLTDSVAAVRVAAAEALYGKSDDKQVLVTLTDVLNSENEFARVEAATVLEKMGADARPVLPVIRRMIDQRDDKQHPKQALWQNSHDVKIAKRIVASQGGTPAGGGASK